MKQKCSECTHNEMGICLLTNKEIGISYILSRNNKAPAYCPLKKEKHK